LGTVRRLEEGAQNLVITTYVHETLEHRTVIGINESMTEYPSITVVCTCGDTLLEGEALTPDEINEAISDHTQDWIREVADLIKDAWSKLSPTIRYLADTMERKGRRV
jgi:hypothetical protein